jgi:hypothetical protein
VNGISVALEFVAGATRERGALGCGRSGSWRGGRSSSRRSGRSRSRSSSRSTNAAEVAVVCHCARVAHTVNGISVALEFVVGATRERGALGCGRSSSWRSGRSSSRRSSRSRSRSRSRGFLVAKHITYYFSSVDSETCETKRGSTLTRAVVRSTDHAITPVPSTTMGCDGSVGVIDGTLVELVVAVGRIVDAGR